jgi:hypothetical protein
MSFTYASLLYSTTNDKNYIKVKPRLAYEFYVQFKIITFVEGTQSIKTVTLPIANSVDYPTVNIETVQLNQYNTPRVVQTKLRWSTFNITFYNTEDNQAEILFKEILGLNYESYLTNYKNPFIINKIFGSSGETNFGYKPLQDIKYVLPSIEIFRGYGGPGNNITSESSKTVDVISANNCTITSISGSTFNYSESNPQTLTVTVQPEDVVMYNKSKEDKENSVTTNVYDFNPVPGLTANTEQISA